MNRLGQKRIQFRKVVVPGSVKLRQLMAEPHVIELARSFQQDSGGRPLQAPTLDAQTFRLVAGADRFAAMKVNGDESAIFELVEGSEEELRRLSIVENLRRRNDDQQKLMRQLVEAAQAQIEKEAAVGECPEINAAKTKPLTVKGAAIRRVAKESKKPERTIARAVQREEKAEREEDLNLGAGVIDVTPADTKSRAVPSELPAPKPIRAFGLAVPQPIADGAERMRTMVDEMSALCRTLAAKLTALEKTFPSLGQQQSARHGLDELSHAVRRARPESLCPYCKGDEIQQPKCHGCKGLGFVSKVMLVDCPKELLAEGTDCGIYVDGKWREVLSF